MAIFDLQHHCRPGALKGLLAADQNVEFGALDIDLHEIDPLDAQPVTEPVERLGVDNHPDVLIELGV
ncbi:Uncharacterised protein [Mycobacteroides abscessus subsp. massiliense]|nr:Uncharacterised protein [Mycobacteroides abscessus subsp. massiliense]